MKACNDAINLDCFKHQPIVHWQICAVFSLTCAAMQALAMVKHLSVSTGNQVPTQTWLDTKPIKLFAVWPGISHIFDNLESVLD